MQRALTHGLADEIGPALQVLLEPLMALLGEVFEDLENLERVEVTRLGVVVVWWWGSGSTARETKT